eukprot:TRINITY_DN18304_c0_g1_i1.p1 TRINITY_DN18304_c0_g1~~TRINITY_DN18304_c0_g1_i1.p1  ORF type:complete len:285 (+),score=39.74 TRINITY_DN18304_c0_g1_i1:47-901(+)
MLETLSNMTEAVVTFVIYNIPTACSLWWVVAIAIYSLKALSTKFDQMTSYGKLRPTHLLSTGVLSRKNSFLLFYFIGIVTIAAHVFIVDAYNKSTVVMYPTMVCLFLLHLTTRIFECTLVHKWSDEMVPLLSVIAGLGFYVFAGLTVTSSSMFIFIGEISEKGPAFYERHTPSDPLIAVIFIAARFLQFKHHQFLAQLRSDKTASKNGPKYRLPTRWMFTYFACPHYLCEMFLYYLIAFYVASTATKLMAAFVCLNLLSTSVKTANWYEETFKAKRYALVPGLL